VRRRQHGVPRHEARPCAIALGYANGQAMKNTPHDPGRVIPRLPAPLRTVK
jgi:hypothetical protein